jgi:hypothetical protein
MTPAEAPGRGPGGARPRRRAWRPSSVLPPCPGTVAPCGGPARPGGDVPMSGRSCRGVRGWRSAPTRSAKRCMSACLHKRLPILNARGKPHQPWHVQEGPSA